MDEGPWLAQDGEIHEPDSSQPWPQPFLSEQATWLPSLPLVLET